MYKLNQKPSFFGFWNTYAYVLSLLESAGTNTANAKGKHGFFVLPVSQTCLRPIIITPPPLHGFICRYSVTSLLQKPAFILYVLVQPRGNSPVHQSSRAQKSGTTESKDITMKNTWAIAIHGGAENKNREEISESKQAAYEQGLENALMAGWRILHGGGSAVAAVEAAVRSMENNPLFNAARGGSLSQDKSNEFDAAIMDGKTMQAGAVAGVKHVKHPITLAKTIMQQSKHVLLCATGAEKFAREHNLELKADPYFKTEEKEKALKEAQKEEATFGNDTVGAVALDKEGNLAAATSTGGLVNQYPGRVGDSPIIGSGTYANNEVCAISCTGDGEGIMRANVAHEV